MTTQTTDIAIVGAGPAGARAAELLAAHGADVTLLDPKAPWEKPCGGGLTHAAFADVPELREIESRTRRIETVRVETDDGRGFKVPLSRPIRVVSRLDLGRWQLDRALAAGVVHRGERVRSIRRARRSWSLTTDGGRIDAAFLVGADGASSRVRRTVKPKFEIEMAPTRVAFVPGGGEAPETIRLRFFPGVAGYLWDFPRPGHRSVGVGIQDGRWKGRRMDAAIDGYRREGTDCICGDDDPLRAGAVIGTAQVGHGDYSSLGGDTFALLGDAGGLADPTTGEGIRNALRSAELAATAWAMDGSFAVYPTMARQAFHREFQVSRIVRRLLFEGDTGSLMVTRASTSPVTLAAVATMINAANEQEWTLPWLARRWMSVRRWASTAPAASQDDQRRTRCGCNDARAVPDTRGCRAAALAASWG